VAASAGAGTLSTNANTAGSSTLFVHLHYPTQTVTFAVVAQPLNGTVTITNVATGAFTYTPAAGYAGTDTFTFHVTDSYGAVSNTNTESVTVLGAVASLTPPFLDFGAITAGQRSSDETFTLQNTGNTTLTGISVSLGGANANLFEIFRNNCGSSLSAGSQCTVVVTFTPNAIGSFSASLVVANSGATGTQMSNLSGIGQDVLLSPSSGLSFGNVNKGSSSTLAATLTNATPVSISISRIQIGLSHFTQTNNCGSSLAAGASCTISVKFSPTTDGWSGNGSLTVINDGPRSHISINVSGTGVN
jgi:hypothetical protein